MSFNTLTFKLTPKQTQQYRDWLKNVAALHSQEQENLDQVTISFTITPQGQFIMAHTGCCIPTDGFMIVIKDL